METVILTGRVESLGKHKTYEKRGKIIVWDKTLKYRYKFLVVEGKLIIAPIDDHLTLYMLYQTKDLQIKDAKVKLSTTSEEEWLKGPPVTCAGRIDGFGKVVDWISFHFQTPIPDPTTAKSIQKEITALFHKGQLNP